MKYVVICDTNLLISASVFPGSISAKAFMKARNECHLVASVETLSEFFEVLHRTKFDKYIDLPTRLRFFDAYQERILLIDIRYSVTDCRNPKDDKFLNLALSANARYLITGDPDLLILHPYYQTQILTPAQFLER
jgi:putative PIN family toxin of toxin-antitoxin system